jgi:hypothetical protein
MQPGEPRVAIVPAYGRTGYYPPEVPGQQRLVIGPNTTVVYELEALKPEFP